MTLIFLGLKLFLNSKLRFLWMHIFFEHKIFMVTMMFWTQSFENSTTNILEPWIQNPHQPANHVILGKILSNRNIQILYHQIGYLTDYSFQPQFFCLYILYCKCVDLFFYMIMICPGISWTIRHDLYLFLWCHWYCNNHS